MKDFIWFIGVTILFLIALFLFAWFSAIQEAKTFNKYTDGPQATTWDAFFSELRVDARRANSK